jgi:DNA-binding response OmpR family regulator
MILIVDQNREHILSLRSLFNTHKLKFEVDSAYCGKEALNKILQHQYTLVILNILMPRIDGFEVAELILRYNKSRDIPIIFLSDEEINNEHIRKKYTTGMVDYLVKPYDPEILLIKIKTFYRLSKQTQQLIALEKSLREEISLRKKPKSF